MKEEKRNQERERESDNKQADGQTNRQINKHIVEQTDRQTKSTESQSHTDTPLKRPPPCTDAVSQVDGAENNYLTAICSPR